MESPKLAGLSDCSASLWPSWPRHSSRSYARSCQDGKGRIGYPKSDGHVSGDRRKPCQKGHGLQLFIVTFIQIMHLIRAGHRLCTRVGPAAPRPSRQPCGQKRRAVLRNPQLIARWQKCGHFSCAVVSDFRSLHGDIAFRPGLRRISSSIAIARSCVFTRPRPNSDITLSAHAGAFAFGSISLYQWLASWGAPL